MVGVTVIIPTRNRVDYLEEALESVFRQSYQNIECVVIDDRSSDGTREFLNSIDDERLRVVRCDQHRGPARARNLGLEVASGEYIAFLDDDDRLHENAIGTMVSTLREQPRDCAGVYSAYREFRPGEAEVKPVPDGRVENIEDLRIQGLGGKLFRTSVFEEVGPLDDSFIVAEDLEWMVRVFREYFLVGLDRPLYERRKHGNQLTGQTELVIEGNTELLEKHEGNLTPRYEAKRYYVLSHKYAQLGRPATARSHLRAAARKYPRDKSIYYYHFWLLFGVFGYVFGKKLGQRFITRIPGVAH